MNDMKHIFRENFTIGLQKMLKDRLDKCTVTGRVIPTPAPPQDLKIHYRLTSPYFAGNVSGGTEEENPHCQSLHGWGRQRLIQAKLVMSD